MGNQLWDGFTEGIQACIDTNSGVMHGLEDLKVESMANTGSKHAGAKRNQPIKLTVFHDVIAERETNKKVYVAIKEAFDTERLSLKRSVKTMQKVVAATFADPNMGNIGSHAAKVRKLVELQKATRQAQGS